MIVMEVRSHLQMISYVVMRLSIVIMSILMRDVLIILRLMVSLSYIRHCRKLKFEFGHFYIIPLSSLLPLRKTKSLRLISFGYLLVISNYAVVDQ